MRNYITILILFFSGFHDSFSQAKEIFPDFIDFGLSSQKRISLIDRNSGSARRIIIFDNRGRLIEEVFFDYKPIIGKSSIDGKFSYSYDKLEYPTQRFYTNKHEDTLKVLYYYTANGDLVKRISWEFERKTKLRKGAPDYYDGSPYGCIPAEEDLIRYREWIKRQIIKYKYSKHSPIKIKAPYEYGNEPRTWKFKYDNALNLIEKNEIKHKSDILSWTETYQYTDSSIVKAKEYFITYWDKIPPKEYITTTIINKKTIRIRIDYENTNDFEMIDFKYDDSEKLVELIKIKNNSIYFDYLIEYE